MGALQGERNQGVKGINAKYGDLSTAAAKAPPPVEMTGFWVAWRDLPQGLKPNSVARFRDPLKPWGT